MQTTNPDKPTASDVRIALREYYEAKAQSDAALQRQLELDRVTNEKEIRIRAILEQCQTPGGTVLTSYPPEDFLARQLADLFSEPLPTPATQSL